MKIKFTAWHSGVKIYSRYKMIGNVTGKMSTGAIVNASDDTMLLLILKQ